MACIHFEENGRATRCRAVEGTLIPSHFERERYCHGDENRTCPTQRLYQLRGTPLSQEVYYRLWIAEPDDWHVPAQPAQPQRSTSARIAH
jgi:hypothetical protein